MVPHRLQTFCDLYEEVKRNISILIKNSSFICIPYGLCYRPFHENEINKISVTIIGVKVGVFLWKKKRFDRNLRTDFLTS